jgi:uncharacterized membrane protein
MQSITRHIISGVLAIIPLVVTVWIVWFVIDQLIWLGRPAVLALASAMRPTSPQFANLLLAGWFQSAIALAAALFILYLVGRAANAVIGRRLLQLVDRVMEMVPVARTIYSATQTLIRSVGGGEGAPNAQHVVLIEFPGPHMRTVGLVTKIFPATEDQPELAAVYVPTTPNPTSGYVEIVPTSRLTWLNWSRNDAMAFIVSGGAMSPQEIPVKWIGEENSPPREDKKPRARRKEARAKEPSPTR